VVWEWSLLLWKQLVSRNACLITSQTVPPTQMEPKVCHIWKFLLIKNVLELISESWKFNFNYWTRGFYFSANSSWSWLDLQTQTSEPVLKEMGWLNGHPKNDLGLECINFKVFTNIPGEKIKLGARNCSHKFIYICEVSCYIKKQRQI